MLGRRTRPTCPNLNRLTSTPTDTYRDLHKHTPACTANWLHCYYTAQKGLCLLIMTPLPGLEKPVTHKTTTRTLSFPVWCWGAIWVSETSDFLKGVCDPPPPRHWIAYRAGFSHKVAMKPYCISDKQLSSKQQRTTFCSHLTSFHSYKDYFQQ